jgi:hypothetical protein
MSHDENDNIERPENIEALTLDQLRALHADAAARVTELQALPAPTLAEVREMRRLVALANEVVTLVGEVSDSAVLSVLDPEPEEIEVEDPAPGEEEAPAEDESTQLARAAAAGLTAGALAGAAATPSPQDPGEAAAASRAVFVAAVGSAGVVSAGEVVNYDEMRRIIEHGADRSRSMVRSVMAGGSVGDSDREVRVASINLRSELDGDLVVSGLNGAARNTAIIDATPLPDLTPGARTAAVCGPADIIREIPDCIGMGRPIRALFRQVPSDHSAFQFIPSIGLASVASGVTDWTDADQALVDEADPSTWKPCVPLECGVPVQVLPERVPSCLTVEVMQSLSTPEQVQNWIATINAQTERVAEGVLLRRIDALSSSYTGIVPFYGALVELYDTLATLLGMAQDINRQIDVSGYVLIVPAGMKLRVGLDNWARIFGPGGSLGDLLTALGIRMVETADPALGALSPWAGSFPLNPPGAVAIALPPAPTTWRLRLLDPASAFFFSPDEFAFGMSRDPQLMRQNRMQWFGELFEGLGKNGCAPWFTFDIDLCPNGDRDFGSAPIPCVVPLGFGSTDDEL